MESRIVYEYKAHRGTISPYPGACHGFHSMQKQLYFFLTLYTCHSCNLFQTPLMNSLRVTHSTHHRGTTTQHTQEKDRHNPQVLKG